MTQRKALVVDDDPGIRFALALKLRSGGYETFEASDGVEALEFLQGQQVDVITIDVGMPRMDGYTLARELYQQESTRELPLLILTAQDTAIPSDIEKQIGRHRFLMKPFSPKVVMATIDELLGSGVGDS